MKKIILVFTILFLIIITTLTKNSAKKLENDIFLTKENISVLNQKYELTLLDYNFLTSPKKLLEYQSEYFENEMILSDINDFNELIIINKDLLIKRFNKSKEENE